MKRTHFLLLGIFLLPGVFFSCAYTNYDDYYAEPAAGPDPVFSISTNLDSSDRVSVGDSLQVDYTVHLENADLYYIRASVDYLVIYSTNPVYDPDTVQGALVFSDSFFIDGALGSAGDTMLLLLDVFHSTNTGSLADIIGAEYQQQQSEFILFKEGGDQ